MGRIETADWLNWARFAVEAFGFDGAEIDWLSQTHNVVFAVRHEDKQYVLRLGEAPQNNLDWLRSELTYLRIIRDMMQLAAPYPRFTQSGEPYFTIPIDDPPLYGVLFDHVEGESPQPDQLTADDMSAIGQFLAKLHDASPRYPPPRGFHRPRLDWDGLFAGGSIYDPGDGVRFFTPEIQAVLDEVTAQVQGAMQAIGMDARQFGLIHGDLLTKNILFHGGEVRALDFEFCGWGYFLYDLTPLLWQLKPLPHYAELAAGLWRGYTSYRAGLLVHYDKLETLIAARQVASCRWVAKNHDHPYVAGRAAEIIAGRAEELADFLQTGTLNRS